MDPLFIIGFLIIASVAFGLTEWRQRQFRRSKPTVAQMERYLGPIGEWEHLPISDLPGRFRDRGWRVNDSDLVFDTFAKIRHGTLEDRG